ncbi:Uncharacterised protein [Pseudomonas putida]|jgi:hypothetical protein|uniref:Uncharacterized protein n=2 Tax=Pseudomonas TaxID=286 RepID=A0AAX0VZL4_9PSED|nr:MULTISPECIES: hypothetical protein [Pseudomonas]MBH3358557.1 hypothetical protein [Pseudomonas guariconensis]MCO7623057.1 hypothetical protein [Pseudomonas guariconensis]MDM9594569.1 hypothetical protein [Pseudomonas guariconensis]MDM9607399.1 hypothetical protein [Pseudomonas guariconensis]MDM9612355.1 hypothetical protein [Pseudomonas guariconensis]
MRIRGNVFWNWADATLHHRTHQEALDDGTCIDVQVRLSRTGATQLFIGVYARGGKALHEEAFDARPGETMTRALAWGVGRARWIAGERVAVPACAK